jgi:hypothetical protein
VIAGLEYSKVHIFHYVPFFVPFFNIFHYVPFFVPFFTSRSSRVPFFRDRPYA